MVRGSSCGGQRWITLSASGSLTRVDESLSAVSDLVVDIEIVHVFFKNSSPKGYFDVKMDFSWGNPCQFFLEGVFFQFTAALGIHFFGLQPG